MNVGSLNHKRILSQPNCQLYSFGSNDDKTKFHESFELDTTQNNQTLTPKQLQQSKLSNSFKAPREYLEKLAQNQPFRKPILPREKVNLFEVRFNTVKDLVQELIKLNYVENNSFVTIGGIYGKIACEFLLLAENTKEITAELENPLKELLEEHLNNIIELHETKKGELKETKIDEKCKFLLDILRPTQDKNITKHLSVNKHLLHLVAEIISFPKTFNLSIDSNNYELFIKYADIAVKHAETTAKNNNISANTYRIRTKPAITRAQYCEINNNLALKEAILNVTYHQNLAVHYYFLAAIFKYEMEDYTLAAELNSKAFNLCLSYGNYVRSAEVETALVKTRLKINAKLEEENKRKVLIELIEKTYEQ